MQACSMVLHSAHSGNSVYEIKQSAVRLRTAQVNGCPIQVLSPALMTALVFIAVFFKEFSLSIATSWNNISSDIYDFTMC